MPVRSGALAEHYRRAPAPPAKAGAASAPAATLARRPERSPRAGALRRSHLSRSGTTLNTTERYLHAIRASEFADAATRALTPRPEQARTLAAVPVEPAARSSSGRTSEAHPPNNPCPPKWGTPFHHCGTISRHSRMAAARRHAQPPQAPLSRRREGQRWPRRAGPARPTGGTSLNVALRGHGKAAGPATAPRRPRPGAGGQARRAVRSRACGRRA